MILGFKRFTKSGSVDDQLDKVYTFSNPKLNTFKIFRPKDDNK